MAQIVWSIAPNTRRARSDSPLVTSRSTSNNRCARSKVSPSSELLCHEATHIYQSLCSALPQTVEAAETLLTDHLDLVQVDRRAEILEDLERLSATSHLLHQAVRHYKDDHYRRRDRGIRELEQLWGGDFIPEKYRPASLSCDLVREMLGLSKVIDQSRLSDLWKDGDGLLPQLMQRRPVTQRRTHVTARVIQLAREQLEDQKLSNVTMTKRRRRQDHTYQPPRKRSCTPAARFDPHAVCQWSLLR